MSGWYVFLVAFDVMRAFIFSIIASILALFVTSIWVICFVCWSCSIANNIACVLPLRRVSLSRREMSVSYAPFDAEVVIVGVVDDDENIKQLLNLSTIFVVDVKVVLYL